MMRNVKPSVFSTQIPTAAVLIRCQFHSPFFWMAWPKSHWNKSHLGTSFCFPVRLVSLKEKIDTLFAVRIRSTIGGYLFTGVCQFTGGTRQDRGTPGQDGGTSVLPPRQERLYPILWTTRFFDRTKLSQKFSWISKILKPKSDLGNSEQQMFVFFVWMLTQNFISQNKLENLWANFEATDTTGSIEHGNFKHEFLVLFCTFYYLKKWL